jgi:hypothetical protein
MDVRSDVRTLIFIAMLVSMLGCGKSEPQKATSKPTAETKVEPAKTPKDDPCSILRQYIDEAGIIISNTEGADQQRRLGDIKIEIAKKSRDWSEVDRKRATLANDYIEARTEAFRLIRAAKVGTAEDIRNIEISSLYTTKAAELQKEILNGCK